MADTWIKFGMNVVCYDRQAKEVVKVTNGACTLDHSTPAGFAAAHKREDGSVGCCYAPCEAIALRCVGVDAKGSPRMAFTYRKVDPDQLSECKESAWIDPSQFRKSLFIGRV